MSSSKEFVFGSDRHHGTAKESDQGGTLISAGDLIDRGGLQREYNNEEAFKAAAETELDKISDNYEQAIIVAGNHDDTDYFGRRTDYDASVEEIAAEEYDDENITVVNSKKSEEGVKRMEDVEGLDYDLVLGSPHQDRTPFGKCYLEDTEKVKAAHCYEKDNLQEAANKLEKKPEEVTLGDIDMLLEEQPQEQAEETDRTEADQEAGSYLRNILTSIPVAGEKIFEPIYSKVDEIRNEYFEEEETEEADEQKEEESRYEVSFGKSQQHKRLKQDGAEMAEGLIQSVVDKIDGAENKVIFVDHGEPRTEDGPGYTSAINREIIERSENAEYMLTGHSHSEMNREIGGTKVRNPGQGYYAGLESFEKGESKGYEDSEFPDDEVDRRTGDGQAPDASASDEEAAAA